MDMQGQRQLYVTQRQAWEALNNPDMLKACIPGCDKFEAHGENQYNVGVAIKIGPVSAKFTGKVTLSDIQAPTSYALPNAEGCELNYTVHSTVGGKLAQLGQRLIDGAAKSLAEDFFRRFDEALQAQYPRSETTASPTAAPAATAGAMPTWIWAVGGAVVLAAVWLFTR